MLNSFLLWEDGRKIVAKKISELDDVLFIGNERFEALHQSFSDYDAIVDDNGRLIGFSFYVDGSEPLLSAPIIVNSSNAIIDGGQLIIMIGNACKFSIETIQGMGVRVYGRLNGDYAVGIPDCEYNEIGFTV